MKDKYKDYLNKDQHFDKSTMLGIICLIIVIGSMSSSVGGAKTYDK